MTDNVNLRSNNDPKQTQRDPSQMFNQLRPTSLASSGTELDDFCPTIEQATAGKGLDAAVAKITKEKP